MKNRTLITHGAVLLTVAGSISVASGSEAYQRQLARRYAKYDREIAAIARRGDWNGYPINKVHEMEDNLKQEHFGYPFTEEKYKAARDAYLDLEKKKEQQEREREREIQ